MGGVFGRPDDSAAVVGQFLRGTEVVELVVERAGVCRAFSVKQRQRAEAAGLVNVAAVVLGSAFGDELVALPEKLRGLAVDGFADAPTEGVVAVADTFTVRGADADQAVLAVIGVLGDLGRHAAAFADQVAEGVVVVVAVAMAVQTVALEHERAWTATDQQIAGRIMGEALRERIAVVAYAGQAVERIVLIVALAVTAVGNLQEIALGAVGILAAIQRSLLLADAMDLQAALLVVGVIAEQQALLALPFAPADKTVAGQARAIEIDGSEGAPLGMVVEKDTVVRKCSRLTRPQAV